MCIDLSPIAAVILLEARAACALRDGGRTRTEFARLIGIVPAPQ